MQFENFVSRLNKEANLSASDYGCSKRIIYYPDIRLPDIKLSG